MIYWERDQFGNQYEWIDETHWWLASFGILRMIKDSDGVWHWPSEQSSSSTALVPVGKIL